MAEKKETKVSELVYIQSSLKAPKNQRNTYGGYNYRSCEDIMEAVKPLLKEVNCSLTVSDEIVQVSDRVYVKATATLRTPSGEQYVNTAFAREAQTKKGMDESQVTGAASSYARKYALNGLFCIDDTKDADATNTHDAVGGGAVGGTATVLQQSGQQAGVKKVAVGEAQYKAEIAACASMDALMAVWQKYPQMQQDKGFRDAWAARRGQVEKK